MEKVLHIVAVIQANLPIVLAVLLGISEALSVIPQVKANGIFQAIANALKVLKEKLAPAKAE
jgi:hypothetical protein